MRHKITPKRAKHQTFRFLKCATRRSPHYGALMSWERGRLARKVMVYGTQASRLHLIAASAAKHTCLSLTFAAVAAIRAGEGARAPRMGAGETPAYPVRAYAYDGMRARAPALPGGYADDFRRRDACVPYPRLRPAITLFVFAIGAQRDTNTIYHTPINSHHDKVQTIDCLARTEKAPFYRHIPLPE